MFEFCLQIDGNKKVVRDDLLNSLQKDLVGLDAIVTAYELGDKYNIMIACEESEACRVSFFICDAVADVVATFYKLAFIENNLKLKIADEIALKAFKKALVLFDKETDKYIVTRSLKIEKNLDIDSFYNFRLRQLRSKWLEIIKLANENAGYLLCSEVFIDLLKFLIENIEVSTGVVNVLKSENGFEIKDEQFHEIEEDRLMLLDGLDYESGKDVKLITSLIALSPKKINVYCSMSENNSALTLLSQIFESRINILPAMKG